MQWEILNGDDQQLRSGDYYITGGGTGFNFMLYYRGELVQIRQRTCRCSVAGAIQKLKVDAAAHAQRLAEAAPVVVDDAPVADQETTDAINLAARLADQAERDAMDADPAPMDADSLHVAIIRAIRSADLYRSEIATRLAKVATAAQVHGMSNATLQHELDRMVSADMLHAITNARGRSYIVAEAYQHLYAPPAPVASYRNAATPTHEGMHADDVPADVAERQAAIAYLRDGEASIGAIILHCGALTEETMCDLVIEGICGTQVVDGQNTYYLLSADSRMQADLVAMMDRSDCVLGRHRHFTVSVIRYQAGAIGISIYDTGDPIRTLVADAEAAAQFIASIWPISEAERIVWQVGR